MASRIETRVFISYARRDGAELAQRLRQDLVTNGFDVWIDIHNIAGGTSWTVEIENAIDTSDVILALLTPASYRSEICRAEQLRSLRKHKCVIPLLVTQGSDIPLHLEPKCYRDFSEGTMYAEHFRNLLLDIEERNGAAPSERYLATPLTYLSAPPMVANYIGRPEAIQALRNILFTADSRAIALTALEGMGGIGKTVLAQALCRDEVVQEAFPDGIVWITAGRETTLDVRRRMSEITNALGDNFAYGESDLACETQYRASIANKAALIVIDDIWNKADLDPFLAESSRSRFLFTTRDASIARFSNAREYRLDLLDEAQSRALLSLWADIGDAQLPSHATEIIHECGRLPLALSMIGALLRGASPVEWSDMVGLLRRRDVKWLEDQLPDGQQSFFRAIDVSVNALAAEIREKYKRLAILLEDMSAQLPILETVWNTAEAEARWIGQHLVDRSLAQRDSENGGIRLHALQLAYLRAQYSDRESLPLIHGAIRMAAHVIEKDPSQFAGQLAGRLPHGTRLANQLSSTNATIRAPGSWLRPLQPSLDAPGGALIRTISSHSDKVTCVSLSPDGERLISASCDTTIKVWDLNSCRLLSVLQGHRLGVFGALVTPDAQRLLSLSWDHALKIWDLPTGRLLREFQLGPYYGSPSPTAIRSMAVSPDGCQLVTASTDTTLTSWDLETGRAIRRFTGHSGPVDHVAVAPDGSWIISTSWDKTLKIWGLRTAKEIQTLQGHKDSVHRVALTSRAKQAVSGSHDGTLKLWDLERGHDLWTIEAHSSCVCDIALTGDDRQAVSVATDGMLMVWDLVNGSELGRVRASVKEANCVAVTVDGRYAISGDNVPGWLKVWDLQSIHKPRTPSAQLLHARHLTISADGRRCVSCHYDETSRVWDTDTGQEIRRFEHLRKRLSRNVLSFYCSVLTANGQTCISCHNEKRLRIWNIDTGQQLGRLRGHSDAPRAVTISGDCKRAASIAERTVIIWDIETRRRINRIKDSLELYNVALSGDGRRVICSTSRGELKVWDVESGSLLGTKGYWGAIITVWLSPDGRQALFGSAGGNSVYIWEVGSKALETRIWCTSRPEFIHELAVAPDGERFVIARSDNTLSLWSTKSHCEIAALTLDAPTECCALVGNRLAAIDETGRIHFFVVEGPPNAE
jgi:WD40 repeat protein